MKKSVYDFGGYVTKNDLRCSDGRIIRHGAFANCDGKRVPLVYQHQHQGIDNVLGFVDLENRDDGVYGYGSFNETPQGQNAKEMVKHGDLTQMSIYANNLQERAKEVYHGVIREVSLVLSGANPGAVIDNLNFVHSDDTIEIIEDEAVIYNEYELDVLSHAEEFSEESIDEEVPESMPENQNGDKTVADIVEGMSEDKKKALDALIALAIADAQGADLEQLVSEDAKVVHADGPTLQEIFDTFTEEEKNVTYFLVAKAIEEAEKASNEEATEEIEEVVDEEMAQSDLGGFVMHKNVFDQTGNDIDNYLSHSDMEQIFKAGKAQGSLKAGWETFAEQQGIDSNSLQHGITNIGEFFPEAKAVSNQPAMISRRMEWVSQVLGAVHKTPFAKVKSTAANLTKDEARAKGYVKGTQKIEEQILALKRVTPPTTVYKLQKLDRDDVIDITDFDVVAWMKQEMRMMLDEEVARAYLVGDGRLPEANDKINEQCIRPIWTDDEVYAIHTTVPEPTEGQTLAQNFIDAAIRAHKEYKGSGSPKLYIGSDMLTELRLIRDAFGHRMYKNDQELADELRVSSIVEVEVLNGLKRTTSAGTMELGGIIVNLADYNVGTNAGGAVNMFDDFDLDYNKLEWLIETRQSGALVQPASALVLEFASTSDES